MVRVGPRVGLVALNQLFAAAAMFGLSSLAAAATAATAATATTATATTATTIQTRQALSQIPICLIVRSGANIYFDAMTQGTYSQALRYNMAVSKYVTSDSGTVVGLDAARINAQHIDACVENGALAILLSIAPDEPNEVPHVQNAVTNARGEGVLVLALDSPIGDFVDATLKTNNTAAGYAVGKWSYESHPGSDPEVDGPVAILYCPIAYDQNIFDRIVGFVEGYGLEIEYKDEDESTVEEERVVKYYTDPDLVAAREYECSVAESAQVATLDILDEANTGNGTLPALIYATNEVGAFGALAALEQRNLTDAIRIVTIDGSCSGVAEVRDGGFSADAIQRPGKMGELGVDAVDAWMKDGQMPVDVDTGFVLAVSEQTDGAEAATMDEALDACFGPLPGVEGGSNVDSGMSDTSSGVRQLGELLPGAVVFCSALCGFLF